MLADFELMWDGHLGRINIAKHRLELSQGDSKRTHSASFRARLIAQKFEKGFRKCNQKTFGDQLRPDGKHQQASRLQKLILCTFLQTTGN